MAVCNHWFAIADSHIRPLVNGFSLEFFRGVPDAEGMSSSPSARSRRAAFVLPVCFFQEDDVHAPNDDLSASFDRFRAIDEVAA